MPAFDAPRTTDTAAPHVLDRQERETARNKLLALAGDLADHDLRYRLLESKPHKRPLLRVWNSRRQAVGETVSCLRTGDGWEFHFHPTGPVIASAEGVEESGHPASKEAAVKVAERVAAGR